MIQQKIKGIIYLQKNSKNFQNIKFLLTITFAFLINMISFSLMGQNCSIKLNVDIMPSTCQANGEIHCTLSDTAGANLEQIRYSYIPEDGIDAIINTELASATHLRPGAYKVIVRALCATHLSQSEAFTIVADSIEQVIIEQRYDVPTSGVPYHLFTFSKPFGIVPSYACAPTGIVQINIENGTYPYYVDIWQDNEGTLSFVKTVNFNDAQHNGDDPQKYDYRNYYNVDSLGIGNYTLYCYDGCGYHMPSLSVTIPKVVQESCPQQHLLRNSSGIHESYNIITFKEILEPQEGYSGNDDYYRLQNQWESMFEYRFINPTWQSHPDTTQWYPLPPHESESIFIYDTLFSMENYAEIWFQNIILQTRPIQCEDTVFTYDYDIYPQAGNEVSKQLRTETTTVSPRHYDYCGEHTRSYHANHYMNSLLLSNYVLTCESPDSIGCHTDFGYSYSHSITNFEEGARMHHYITLPLKCKITNLSADSVVRVIGATSIKYIWSIMWRVEPELDGDTLVFEVSDAKGCPLYTYFFEYKYIDYQQDVTGEYNKYQWESWIVNDKRFCPGERHQIGLHQQNGLLQTVDVFGEQLHTYDLDTIRIIESPENRYNFTAIADGTEHFMVTKEHPEESFSVDFASYLRNGTFEPGILLAADGLSNGQYVWEITWPCDLKKDTIIQDIGFQKVPEIVTHPKFNFPPECTRLDIIPIAGQYEYGGNTLHTFFDLRQDGPLEHSYNAIGIGDTLFAGLIGEYTISMYTLPEENGQLLAQNPCYVWDTVIVWDGNPFTFDYLYAYVCNGNDISGNIITRGKQGKEPYTYNIYDWPNGNGDIVAQNHVGDFFNQPCHLGQEMSVEMTDACNAHFITNFTISNMEQIRKGWAEDNQNEIILHIGDTCHLYGLSLGEVSYHWTGPNGFVENNQDCLFPITSEMQAGKYHIEILGSGCGILLDSILIRVEEEPCPDAIDYEGLHYHAVRINGLCWTSQNLRSRYYADGRPLRKIYIYKSKDHPNILWNWGIFGSLYTWEQAVETNTQSGTEHTQGICPNGWYVPSLSQYQQLASIGTSALRSPLYWINQSGGTNESGFNALPAGFFNGQTNRYENLLGETRFWAADALINSENAITTLFLYPCSDVINVLSNKENAYSIRCILEE